MKFLKNLMQSLQHCEDATLFLVNLLDAKVTATSLKKDLIEHPNYPSLLAISEVLSTYGIHSLALRLKQSDWEDSIRPPFLAHIKGKAVRHDVFAVITAFSDDSIELYNPVLRKTEKISNEDFVNKYYNGTVLHVETSENAGELKYEQKAKAEKRKNVSLLMAAAFLPSVTLLSCIGLFFSSALISVSIGPAIFEMLALAGVVMGILLVWYELDDYNPAIKQICQAGKSVNCSAVLGSGASKIFGFGWTSIGLSYFLGILLVMLLGGLHNQQVLTVLSWLSLCTLPYVIFSIVYQWRIAKQWCIMCLIVQGLLVSQFVTAWLSTMHSGSTLGNIDINAYSELIFSVLFCFIAVNIVVALLKKSKEYRIKSIELQRLKRNPKIFESLLTKQRAIADIPEGLGVNLGNPDGKYKIIKVCNPYCGPCANAHPIIDELVESNDNVSLQVIFTATNDKNDHKRPPALHLLAINAMNDRELTRKAFNSWYNAPIKNYADFAPLYPIEDDLESFSENIEDMEKWCERTKISYTPTFFINGYQMPGVYSVGDLNAILMSDPIN